MPQFRNLLSTSNLRSGDNKSLLVIPRTKHSSYSVKAFSTLAPHLSNFCRSTFIAILSSLVSENVYRLTYFQTTAGVITFFQTTAGVVTYFQTTAGVVVCVWGGQGGYLMLSCSYVSVLNIFVAIIILLHFACTCCCAM